MPIEPYGNWKKTGKKICSSCKDQKDIYEFHWNSSRNAPSSSCKLCHIDYAKKWSKKNAEKAALAQKKYKNSHREMLRKKGRTRGKEYYKKNREECKSRQAEYYKENKNKCTKASSLSAKKAWFVVGDLVIYKFALYEVIKRTRGGFRIEKRYPWKDDFYYDTMPEVLVTVRRSLRRYMIKHHKQIEVEIDERFIPKL